MGRTSNNSLNLLRMFCQRVKGAACICVCMFMLCSGSAVQCLSIVFLLLIKCVGQVMSYIGSDFALHSKMPMHRIHHCLTGSQLTRVKTTVQANQI